MQVWVILVIALEFLVLNRLLYFFEPEVGKSLEKIQLSELILLRQLNH
jgi:hypothetical protein